LFCQLRYPTAGGICFGDFALGDLGRGDIGRIVGYADHDAHVFTGSWRDNLYYGLKHRPVAERDYDGSELKEREKWVSEAEAAGNPSHDMEADWIDYGRLGITGPDELEREALAIVKKVGLEEDLFQRGLSQLVRPEDKPETAVKILEARHLFAERLAKTDFPGAAELFSVDGYNTNATLSENFLFGRHRDETFDVYHLGKNEYVLNILREIGLYDCLLDIGRRATMHLLDMFGDMAAGDQRISQLSLIGSDDLPKYESLMRKIDSDGMHTLDDDEKNMLFSIAFMLAPAHQRFGLIDAPIQGMVIEARRKFLDGLPDDLRPKLEVFDSDAVCGGITVQCNLLYGRIAQRRHRAKVNNLMSEVVGEIGLREEIIRLGLDSDVGEAGSRLSPGQRQKLALGRSLIKKPDLLVVNEALTALDAEEQSTIRREVVTTMAEGALIWIDREDQDVSEFDQVILMKGGRVVEQRQRDGTMLQAAETTVPKAAEVGLEDEINVLRSVPLLAGLAPETLKLVAFSSERHNFDPDEYVFKSGDKSNGAYIVLSGQMETSVEVNGSKLVIGTVEVGDIVGEVGVLSNVARTASVAATDGGASALLLTRDVFTNLIDSDKSVNEKVIELLSERLASTILELEKTRQEA